MNNRRCSECEKEFTGRSDKKFCSDQCRAMFNNRKKNEEEKLIINVNRVLRRNRSILKRINPNGNSTVDKNFLQEQGFNEKYFTNIYRTKAGTTYYYCYDQGFMHLDNNRMLLVNYKSYMKEK